MLLIQEICLTWNKKDRGVKYARIRTQFPLAYSLEGFLPDGEVGVNYLSFYQRGTKFIDSIQDIEQYLEKDLLERGFHKSQVQREVIQRIRLIKKHRFQSYPSVLDLNLVNLSICSCKEGYEVVFFYDEQRSGVPLRQGHNKDYNNPQSLFYRRDCLNETAFVLRQGQYGRVSWNERRRDFDTGEWYYQMHIYNLFYLEKLLKEDVFLKCKPDFEYKQMAVLY